MRGRRLLRGALAQAVGAARARPAAIGRALLALRVWGLRD